MLFNIYLCKYKYYTKDILVNLQTKRVTISLELYRELLSSAKLDSATSLKDDMKLVSSEIARINRELKEYKSKACIELDEDSENRIKTILALGVAEDKKTILQESIRHYTELKKEELVKMIKEL